MKKLGLNLLELLVEHSPTAGGFAETAGTELCKGNVENKGHRTGLYGHVSASNVK